MKISDSTISMYSKSSKLEVHNKEESLKVRVGNGSLDSKNSSSSTLSETLISQSVTLDLSDGAKALLTDKNGTSAAVDKASIANPQFYISDRDRQKILMLQKLLEHLTGRRIKFVLPGRMQIANGESGMFGITNAAPAIQLNTAPVQRQGWGLEYDYYESYFEKQSLSFSAKGMVKTSDGREINLSIQLNMSRQFAAQQNISIRAGEVARIDPLVINFNGTGPLLTERKFSFDLDSDGVLDNISFVSPNSGFLALDLNSDGKINDGKELFGPQSGDGFSELSIYDEDNNGWIDENDSIYDKLRIWTKDENGNDQLFALGRKGIGAIYLGNVNTEYSIKNSENQLQGQIRKTGIFLNENGTAGTIQHIDLAI